MRPVRAYEGGYKELVSAARVSIEFNCPDCGQEFELRWDQDDEVVVFKA